MDMNVDPKTQAPDSLISPEKGREYWGDVSADVVGMLGGFPSVSRVDLQGSRAFLAKMGIGAKEGLRRLDRVLEGGAGIGRITEGLLLTIANTVDVVEPIPKFTEALASKPGVGRVFNVGLEEWRPAPASESESAEEKEQQPVVYDLVWNQWCVGHLKDDELVEYLVRCAGVLEREKGLIVVKENLSTSGRDVYDQQDSSVTREDKKFRELFEKAGLVIVRTELQLGFPRDLLPVRTYALRPRKSASA